MWKNKAELQRNGLFDNTSTWARRASSPSYRNLKHPRAVRTGVDNMMKRYVKFSSRYMARDEAE
jgi:hypothetical protein